MESGCYDTSNVVKINVINIQNTIYTDDSIFCSYDIPSTIYGDSNAVYSYHWLIYDGQQWNTLNVHTCSYTPAPFSQPYIKICRVVYYNQCIDSSNIITLYKSENFISNSIYSYSSNDTITEGCDYIVDSIGNIITDLSLINWIKWEYSQDATNWVTLNDTSIVLSISLNFSGTMHNFYRRILSVDGCIDTSNIVHIVLYPPIVGNSIQTTINSGSIAYVCQNESVNLISLNINPSGRERYI